MTSIIVEDLKVAADYLVRCCKKSGLVEVLDHFSDVATALEFLNEHTVDLLFLDVEMPGASGFELLDNITYKPKVILTTSKEEYAYNAFQYHVEDFLKKPFTYNRFIESIEKITQSGQQEKQNRNEENHLFIKAENRLVRLEYDDILIIESMNNYVRFVTVNNKKYTTLNTLKNLEKKLSDRYFMKVHRSYMINIRKIEKIKENDLLINGIEVPISKGLKSEILRKLTIV